MPEQHATARPNTYAPSAPNYSMMSSDDPVIRPLNTVHPGPENRGPIMSSGSSLSSYHSAADVDEAPVLSSGSSLTSFHSATSADFDEVAMVRSDSSRTLRSLPSIHDHNGGGGTSIGSRDATEVMSGNAPSDLSSFGSTQGGPSLRRANSAPNLIATQPTGENELPVPPERTLKRINSAPALMVTRRGDHEPPAPLRRTNSAPAAIDTSLENEVPNSVSALMATAATNAHPASVSQPPVDKRHEIINDQTLKGLISQVQTPTIPKPQITFQGRPYPEHLITSLVFQAHSDAEKRRLERTEQINRKLRKPTLKAVKWTRAHPEQAAASLVAVVGYEKAREILSKAFLSQPNFSSKEERLFLQQIKLASENRQELKQ